jgi:hypothetical protein
VIIPNRLKVTVMFADEAGMGTIPCPVEGCAEPVRGFGSKALSRDAACVQAFFPILEHVNDMSQDQLQQEYVEFFALGLKLFNAVHTHAHDRASHALPDQAVKAWRSTANNWCEVVAQVDPKWFVQHWHDAEARGIKVPPSMKRLLRNAERRVVTLA